MATVFPLNIGIKEDYPEKVAATQGIEPKYLLSMAEINKIVAAITEHEGRLIKKPKIVPDAAYVLQADDDQYILHFTANVAVTVTVPAALPRWRRYEGKQIGNGAISVASSAGVMVYTSISEVATTAEKYAVLLIDWLEDDKYVVKGNLLEA